MNNRDISSQNDKIEVKVLIERLRVFWKPILVCLLIFIFVGFLYNRYSTKIYKSSTTILIKEESNSSLGSENLFDGIDLFGGQKNIKNEIGILKSFSLTKKTLKSLNYRVSYFHNGNIKSEDIHSKSPIVVELGNAKKSIVNNEFNIEIISEKEFELTIFCDDVSQYDLKNERYVSNQEFDIEYSAKHNFGELITTPFFEFTINKDNFEFFTIDKWSNYNFIIHSYNDLTEHFLKNLTVNEIDKDASILKISLEGTNPKKINDFLNRFSQLYLEFGLEEKNQIAANTINFINNQLETITDSLSNVEIELESFKINNPKVQIINKDFNSFSQIEKLEEEKAILEFNNKYYISLKSYFQENNNTKNIVAPSAMGINDPLLNALISELSNLYSELEVARVNSKEEHPIVQSLLQQIRSTKLKLNENIENIISSSELSLADINERIYSIDKEIDKLPQQERVLLNIQRKFNLNENIYNYLIEKKAEASITKASNVSDHKILDEPRLISKKPIAPNTILIYLFFIVLGLFTPISIIALYFLLNDKVIDKKDIENITSVPIVGKIIDNIDRHGLVTLYNPKSEIAETFRLLRTNIQYLASDKSQKIICLTSSISGEGKTFIATNLASIISLTGKKAILIGADMRKPKIFDEFGLNNEFGLSSYLSNQKTKKEVIHNTKYENFDLILSGPIPPNPSELLNTVKMKEFIDELKQDYDYVIIDTPPIGLVTDALLIMEYSDINLYVVRQNYTTKDMIYNFNEMFKVNKIKNLNLIVNGITTNQSAYGYGYGYGNTYGYGYYQKDNNQSKSKKWWKKIKL
ncbi:MAG: GumC family protein [Flavobacteriales bacterium]